MIIGVDAGALSITDERLKVGVYRVTFNLLQELSKIDTQNTYRLYSFAPLDRGLMQSLGPTMHNVVLTPSIGWSRFRLPLELHIHPVDIFLGLSQSLPSSSTSHNKDCKDISFKKSLTILSPLLRRLESHRKMVSMGFVYDLAFIYNPQAYPSSFHQLKQQTDQLVKRADKIITISKSSKSDIINHYHVMPEKVSVCYPGVDERFTPVGSVHKGQHQYVLFVGSLTSAKDLPLAIEAFALFLQKCKKPYDFLLIGGDYWLDPRIDKAIHQYKLEKRVKKLGFVSDEKLPQYYRGAVAFFTTALREGFCLPATESMACATPVVSVDRGAMKEIVGEGGIIASSLFPAALADALFSLVGDRKFRLLLKKRAMKRGESFSWKTFAQCVHTHVMKFSSAEKRKEHAV